MDTSLPQGHATSAPESRRQRKSAHTRKLLLDAATVLFLKQGYDATTVAQITEFADVAKGTFFSYFSTKAAIAGALGERILKTMLPEAPSRMIHPTASAGAALSDIFMRGILWHEKNAPLSQIVTRVLLSDPDAFEADFQNRNQLMHGIKALIQFGIKKGEFSDAIDPDIAALCIAGAYFFSVVQWHQNDRKQSLKKQARLAIQFGLRGLKR